ncbi:MAG: hypothetical protein PUK54_07690 [Firmicutes bacterium]|nr:hypothetical protein [Bacillota bacterium]MDY5857314.1 hypothetical protein [Anaerovoracaceae bacterium]
MPERKEDVGMPGFFSLPFFSLRKRKGTPIGDFRLNWRPAEAEFTAAGTKISEKGNKIQ